MNVMGWLWVCAALGGVALGQGAAGAKRPMTFADLMAMKRVSDPQVSPSGKWVMFSVTEVSLEKNTKVTNLWVVPMGGGGREAGPSALLQDDTQERKADSSASLLNDKQKDRQQQGQRPGRTAGGGERQLTFGEVSQTGGRFSPDGRWVLLLSAGGGSSQIWTAKWDDATGTMQKPYPLTDVATEADGAVWSPDSKRILFVSSVYPECSEKGTWGEEDACNKAQDGGGGEESGEGAGVGSPAVPALGPFTGEKRSHVLVVISPDGEKVRDLTPRREVGDAEAPTFSLGGPLGYAWAPDSKEIAYVTNLDQVPAASTNNDVFTLRLDEPGARAVKVSYQSRGAMMGRHIRRMGGGWRFGRRRGRGLRVGPVSVDGVGSADEQRRRRFPKLSKFELTGWMSLCGLRTRSRSTLPAARMGEENILSTRCDLPDGDVQCANKAEFGRSCQVTPDGSDAGRVECMTVRPLESAVAMPAH